MVDVSVVIATYNRSAQVREAIDGVLAQSAPVREIIVVDDGSRDDTGEKLAAYGDRIQAHFRPNGGASAARNFGMRQAKGSWIAFLDDDDVWLPNKIERQMELVEKNPELGLVYCSDYAVDERLQILYERAASAENRGDVFAKLLVRNFIFTSCVMARRDAVEQAGYMDLAFKFAQDWDLWLKIAARHPVDFAVEPLVLYRQSASGCLTRDMKAEDRLREAETILEHALQDRKVSPQVERHARYELERQWASSWLVQGRNRAALPHAARAIGMRPAAREGYRLLAHSLVPKAARDKVKQWVRGNGSVPSPANGTSSAAPSALASASATFSGLPPVIILNMFYSGLAIARDLAGSGVRVIGLSADRNAYGNHTRACEVRFAPDSQSEPERLAEYLVEASGELKGAVVFPTRDADVVFLDRYRDALREYRISIPPHDALRQALDKGILAQAAKDAGVPVPRTMVVRQAADLDLVPGEVGFPCVVKPVSSYQWRGAGRWETVGCRKAFRADTLKDLKEEYARVAVVNPEVLVQEWIPGSSAEIVIMGGYFGVGSEPLGHFCARKLVQEPEDFGTGCVVQNLSINEIVEPSTRLCQALNYRGMAEIEYKRDVVTGEYKLIEINTRHWDWHQLAHLSGVNLTRVAYSDLTGHRLDAGTHKQGGGKWVAEDALLLYSASGLFRGKLKLRTLFGHLAGPKMFGIFSWNDPMPFLHHSFGYMLPRMGRRAWGKLFKA